MKSQILTSLMVLVLSSSALAGRSHSIIIGSVAVQSRHAVGMWSRHETGRVIQSRHSVGPNISLKGMTIKRGQIKVRIPNLNSKF